MSQARVEHIVTHSLAGIIDRSQYNQWKRDHPSDHKTITYNNTMHAVREEHANSPNSHSYVLQRSLYKDRVSTLLTSIEMSFCLVSTLHGIASIIIFVHVQSMEYLNPFLCCTSAYLLVVHVAKRSR
ncbi:unnamed protein product [Albugo candida]|uniref:Uncharacterized protein n=1 Tax=Albugo candida TaxID=65357 RepID=A0A024GAY3_9STRA|nr:unnamed protein product [Albugo candida]|eukprot:CCI43893.1 unnamed protein product [Albugo candida]